MTWLDVFVVWAIVLAQAYELEALMNVLDRRGLITKAAGLEEIRRLRAQAPEAR